MNSPIGFVLVTYNNPEQTLFLCERLTKMFAGPPIVVHHDFGQCELNTAMFPRNVQFVEKWLRTKWGHISVVDAGLLALHLLYTHADPDWFVALSTTDYPINSAQNILDDLFGNDFDAYLHHRLINSSLLSIPREGFGVTNFSHPAWNTLAFERYVAIGFGFFKLATKLGWSRKAIFLRAKFITQRLTPFKGNLQCYAGDAWLTGNRRVAHRLLEDTPCLQKLHDHFSRRSAPDEAFWHTVLCNTPNLKISSNNKRYTDWRGCANHPRYLSTADFPSILSSNCHFGRKFIFDQSMLCNLDEAVRFKSV